MAVYSVQSPDGRIIDIEGDSPPTDSDLDQIFSSVPKSSFKVPASIRKAAQFLTTPIRGTRALGVGAQRAIEGTNLLPMLAPSMAFGPEQAGRISQNLPFALERAAEATKPGYNSIPGERIGSALGETAGVVGLTAPLAAITPAGLAARAATEGVTSGGLTALLQASERGEISPKSVAGMTALGFGLPLLASPQAREVGAKVAGQLGWFQSGVDQRFGERLFKDPGAFFTPTERVAGERLGAFRASQGIKKIPQTAKETVSAEAGEARKYVADIEKQFALSKLGRAAPPTSSQLVKTKQSLNKIIEATNLKQKETRAELFELKNKVDDILEKGVPGEKAASKEYSRSALAGKFRKLFPVTKQGDVSLIRTIGLPAINKSLVASLGAAGVSAIQSPALGGAAITAAGGATKAVQAALKTPAGRQVVQSIVRNLTKEQAKEFLKEVKKENPDISDEDAKEKVREMAKAKGLAIPKKSK